MNFQKHYRQIYGQYRGSGVQPLIQTNQLNNKNDNFFVAVRNHKKEKRNSKGKSSSSSKYSMISTAEMEEIIDYLQMNQHRSTTRKNYYSVWKGFNEFIVRLDRKPESWEQRILLYTAHLIKDGKQSGTVKSYVSAIKAVFK